MTTLADSFIKSFTKGYIVLTLGTTEKSLNFLTARILILVLLLLLSPWLLLSNFLWLTTATSSTRSTDKSVAYNMTLRMIKYIKTSVKLSQYFFKCKLLTIDAYHCGTNSHTASGSCHLLHKSRPLWSCLIRHWLTWGSGGSCRYI